MLAAYTLGQGDICADDPCVSNLCPGYNADICGELKTSATTSSANWCSTDSDCPSGQSCNGDTGACETPQSPGKQITTTMPPLQPASAGGGSAAAASLPSLSGKTIGVLLAIAGVAGIGLFAYSRMKRAPKS